MAPWPREPFSSAHLGELGISYLEAVEFFRAQGWQEPLYACRMLCHVVTALERAGLRA